MPKLVSNSIHLEPAMLWQAYKSMTYTTQAIFLKQPEQNRYDILLCTQYEVWYQL